MGSFNNYLKANSQNKPDEEIPVEHRTHAEFDRIASGMLTPDEANAKKLADDPVLWHKHYAMAKFLAHEYQDEHPAFQHVYDNTQAYILKHYGKDEKGHEMTLDEAYDEQTYQSEVENPLYLDTNSQSLWHKFDRLLVKLVDDRKRPTKDLNPTEAKKLVDPKNEGVVNALKEAGLPEPVIQGWARHKAGDDPEQRRWKDTWEVNRAFIRGSETAVRSGIGGLLELVGLKETGDSFLESSQRIGSVLAPTQDYEKEFERKSGTFHQFTTQRFWTSDLPSMLGALVPTIGAAWATGGLLGVALPELGAIPVTLTEVAAMTAADESMNAGDALLKAKTAFDEADAIMQRMSDPEIREMLERTMPEALQDYSDAMRVWDDPEVAGTIARRTFTKNIVLDYVVNAVTWGSGKIGKRLVKDTGASLLRKTLTIGAMGAVDIAAEGEQEVRQDDNSDYIVKREMCRKVLEPMAWYNPAILSAVTKSGNYIDWDYAIQDEKDAFSEEFSQKSAEINGKLDELRKTRTDANAKAVDAALKKIREDGNRELDKLSNDSSARIAALKQEVEDQKDQRFDTGTHAMALALLHPAASFMVTKTKQASNSVARKLYRPDNAFGTFIKQAEEELGVNLDTNQGSVKHDFHDEGLTLLGELADVSKLQSEIDETEKELKMVEDSLFQDPGLNPVQEATADEKEAYEAYEDYINNYGEDEYSDALSEILENATIERERLLRQQIELKNKLEQLNKALKTPSLFEIRADEVKAWNKLEEPLRLKDEELARLGNDPSKAEEIAKLKAERAAIILERDSLRNKLRPTMTRRIAQAIVGRVLNTNEGDFNQQRAKLEKLIESGVIIQKEDVLDKDDPMYDLYQPQGDVANLQLARRLLSLYNMARREAWDAATIAAVVRAVLAPSTMMVDTIEDARTLNSKNVFAKIIANIDAAPLKKFWTMGTDILRGAAGLTQRFQTLARLFENNLASRTSKILAAYLTEDLKSIKRAEKDYDVTMAGINKTLVGALKESFGSERAGLRKLYTPDERFKLNGETINLNLALQLHAMAMSGQYGPVVERMGIGTDRNGHASIYQAEFTPQELGFYHYMRHVFYAALAKQVDKTSESIHQGKVVWYDDIPISLREPVVNTMGHITFAPFKRPTWTDDVHENSRMNTSRGILDQAQWFGAQVSHWTSFAPIAEPIRGKYQTGNFGAFLDATVGEKWSKAFAEHLNDLFNGRPVRANNFNTMDKVRAASSVIALGYNATSAFKQIASIPSSALLNKDVKLFGENSFTSKLFKPREMLFIYQQVIKSDYMQARLGSGYSDSMQIAKNMQEDTGGSINGWFIGGLKAIAKLYTKKAFVLTQTVDSIAFSIAIAPIVHMAWQSSQNANSKLTLKEFMNQINEDKPFSTTTDLAASKGAAKALREAIEFGWMMGEPSQQSSHISDMSVWLRRGGSFERLVAQFTPTLTQYLAYEINAIEAVMNNSDAPSEARTANLKYLMSTVIHNHVIMPALWGGLSALTSIIALGRDPDDEKKKMKAQWLVESVVSPLEGIPVLSELLTVTARRIWGKAYMSYGKSAATEILSNAMYHAINSSKLYIEGDEKKANEEAVKCLTSLLPWLRQSLEAIKNGSE